MLTSLTLEPQLCLLSWAAPFSERRDARRRRIARAATITGADLQSPIPCVVLDLCGSGARLAVQRDFALPAQFWLSIDREGIVVECRLGWRRGSTAGVEFLATQPKVAEAL
jgi:hypothetical protein